jgi:succinoglycan biosynthesis protein ExoM
VVNDKSHISVCIATYKRPSMLCRCLEALRNLEHEGFTYSIVVVDNDPEQSAREIVYEWQKRCPVRLFYDIEPMQNISLARNKAVANSSGDLIAFIDDDEFPEPPWLMNLFDAYIKFSVDGVLGPVIPFYEGTPPEWLVKSGLCVRSSFQTGTILNNSKYMRTGNVLISRHILDGLEVPFDPKLGRTGGEDADFFDRMLWADRSFIWCNEARVYEAVPEERQKLKYLMRRAFIRGVTSADQEPFISYGTLKSVVAVIVYTISLPFLLAAGRHLLIKYFIKDCDHFAKLFAHCGVKLVRERTF